MEQTTALNQCRNCGNEFTGKFCNICGERVFNPHDKTFRHILEETVHFLTHFEGSFFRTIKTIFKHPGKLSTDYCNGIRKPYYKPTSLYILIVILYLLFPIARGMNMEMKNYQQEGVLGQHAKTEIRKKMEQRNVSFYRLSEKFEAKSVTTSKFLLLLILPLCCFGLQALYSRDKVLFDHFILAIEINTLFLIAIFLLLPILLFPIALLAGSVMNYIAEDVIFGPIYLVLMIGFSVIAFRRFYQDKTIFVFIKAAIFTLLHAFISFTVYKFLLFKTVMALI